MLKNNLKIIILFAAVFFAGILSAQQPDETAKRSLEREIKVSGNYLYGEAVANTKDEAVKMAKTVLISEINKEALNHPEWQFAKNIQAKEVEYNTDMIDLMRGNKFRVIAYIKKDNIQVVFGNSKTPNVKMEDKKVIKEETKTVTQSPKSQTVTAVQATPASIPAQPKVEETKISVSETPKPAPVKNADSLLGQILNATSMREIQKILQENKKTGKAAYGTLDKLTAPEKAYFIVYKKTGEIIAILDKGSAADRKDLLSGEVKTNAILEQNQVIWFQLF